MWAMVRSSRVKSLRSLWRRQLAAVYPGRLGGLGTQHARAGAGPDVGVADLFFVDGAVDLLMDLAAAGRVLEEDRRPLRRGVLVVAALAGEQVLVVLWML
jgi:hypothetical protein